MLDNFYNTRRRLSDAFAAVKSFKLSDPPTQHELNQVSEKETRRLKIAILKVVIDALLLGEIEDELEYNSIQDAINDAPNQISDPDELRIVQTNLAEYAIVLASLPLMTDKKLVMTQIVGAKGLVNKLAEKDGNDSSRFNRLNLIELPTE